MDIDITRLYFGKAAAESEVPTNPDRFWRTYLDRWNLSELVLEHEKFLILGPKGSGKSAAAYYVELDWKRRFGNESVFFSLVDFDELNRTQSPLPSIDKKLVSDEVSTLTDAAWKLFLGVRLLDSLIGDNACSLSQDPKVLQFVSELRKAGLASDDYPQVLRRVRERKGGVKIPYASYDVTARDSDIVSPGQLGDAIINMIASAKTPNRHLLAIDGLDKAIGDNDAYWRTLAALIRVGDKVTRKFLTAGNRNVYLMIMCRSDVFRRVDFADAPKIAADSGIHMDWGAELQDFREVLLWDYLARKAEIDRDQLLTLLPDYVYVGADRPISAPKYILDFTRYTPRDMTELFRSIQSRAKVYRPLTGEQLRAAADSFANNHLLHEIKSESVGLLPGEATKRLEQVLSCLPSRIFDKSDLTQALSEADLSDKIPLSEFGEYLFLQGAIGNYRADRGYVQFYHRRNTAAFDRRGPWVLHTGLTYALNLPFS
ncbi:P-loop ATPase, Sll1717 family [Streptomyces sp. T028]|uniref:P-loop ATPase, Sll1717 family n=1 Tax=Streptomyces sp. T028 TaxID=3394379 RepID=UPI003A88E272